MAAALVVVAGLGPAAAMGQQRPPTRGEVEAEMGLRSEGDVVRGQLDTVGFPVTAEQAEDVIAVALRPEGMGGESPGGPLVGGVCPHDDHLYAAQVYVHVTQRIAAPRVLLVGVFHKAREWQLADRIPWCGRFSIPFGLELLRKTAALSGAGVPRGALLRYGTSLSEPELPVSAASRGAGLGKTAPSNLHHWVGYAAVGYTLEASAP